ncbi:MAG: hypothetical protein IE909_04235 [Campylobacterales bacterium]|nr:hypothetical protein [Campylobacterales bacterium]
MDELSLISGNLQSNSDQNELFDPFDSISVDLEPNEDDIESDLLLEHNDLFEIQEVYEDLNTPIQESANSDVCENILETHSDSLHEISKLIHNDQTHIDQS